jgi:hypothetical protein
MSGGDLFSSAMVGQTKIILAMPSRHCEERKRRSNPIRHRRAGLLRGVYRRAGHFGPDPLAHNDDNKNRSRDASSHPSFANHDAHEENVLPPKGGGAPIGAPSMAAHGRQVCANLRNSSAARQRLGREPLAFRRSAAALARANASAVGSAPVPAFPETRLDECYPLSPVSSLPSSSEAGRRAGRAVAQSRPGAVCETARGHRTRSASRSHPECALR